tara:strand:- start:23 stop:316 length:294 start_codon:yes stop_codon:yes gene_type:complete
MTNVTDKDRLLGRAIQDECGSVLNYKGLCELLSEHRESQWQDISTAPKDNAFIAYCPHMNAMPACFLTDGSVLMADGQIVNDATHWQPLITPPKESK